MKRQKNKTRVGRDSVEPKSDDPLEQLRSTAAGRAYLKKAEASFAAQAKSSDVVLPGPLAEAFADGSRTIGGHKLLPVTLGLVAILDQIKSPLLDVIRIMRESLGATVGGDESTTEGKTAAHAARMKLANERIVKEIKADDAASVETVFCFLHHPSELRKILATGRDHFREHAMATLGDVVHPVTLAKLQQAVAGHYAASYATVIQHGDKPKEGEVFIPPPAGPKTA